MQMNNLYHQNGFWYILSANHSLPANSGCDSGEPMVFAGYMRGLKSPRLLSFDTDLDTFASPFDRCCLSLSLSLETISHCILSVVDISLKWD